MKLYFWRFTDLHLLFCLDGTSIKQKYGLLLTAVLSFCLVCQITLFTTFQTFWRKICHKSRACPIFCLQTISTHRLLHPQPNVFIWKTPRLIWCGSTQDIFGHIFWLSIKHCALGCCHCCGKSCHDWTMLFPCSKGRSFLLEYSRHVTVVAHDFEASSRLNYPPGVIWNTRQECASILLSDSWPAIACLLHFSFLLILQK